MRLPSAPFLILFVTACSTNPLDVGSDLDDGSGSSATGGSATGGSATGGSSSGGVTANGGSAGLGSSGVPSGGTGTGGTMTSCTDTVSFVGEWSGAILDSSSEPTESIRLSIVENDAGTGGVQGTFTWGEGDPPPPATDPSAPYPPGQSESGVLPGAPWPGFPYTIVGGAACDSAIQLSVSTREHYDSWCSLQEPIDNGPLGFSCIRLGVSSGFDDDTCWTMDADGERLGEYPLWLCGLCGGLVVSASACACDASGCRANLTPTSRFELTMSAGGGVLTGPDSSCADCTVRLERVE
ncbi:MAG TPA: hypothetical protein VFZ53_34300 [Polyangiaceae bacterium]